MNTGKLAYILSEFPKYRLKQAEEAIFSHLIENWDQATGLPKNIRELLNKECSLEIKAKDFSSKSTISNRALIYLDDGSSVETVLLFHKDGRRTVCVSSQVGCPLACSFCATGKLGFRRNLTTSEITDQVLYFARILKKQNERVTNVVFMGMGEPFLNYQSVLEAIKIFNEKLAISARKISVSTSGITPGITKFTKEKIQANLALSLHAPNDKLRSKLMPVNIQHPLELVMSALGEYIKITKRKVMIEYIMIDGVNDTPELAKELATLLKTNLKKLFFVNLIACNPTGGYGASTKEAIEEFKKILEDNGIDVIQRYTFGRDIKGACGQLALNKS